MILSENIGFSFCSPALSQTSIDILTTVVRNTKPPLSELLVCQAFPVVAQCTLRTDDNAIMQVNKTKTKRSRNNYVTRGHFNCVKCSMWCNTLITSLLSPERRWVSAGVRLHRPRAGCPVAGRPGKQRPLVRHAGGQPAAGSPDVRVHCRLRGQVGVHFNLSGWNWARWAAGSDPPSDSEQDAASRDPQCHAGRKERWLMALPKGRRLNFFILIEFHWMPVSEPPPVSPPSPVSDHGVCPPGSLSAGTSAGVFVQPAWTDRETRPGVRHDRVDEQAAPFLRAVRGEGQVRKLQWFYFGLQWKKIWKEEHASCQNMKTFSFEFRLCCFKSDWDEWKVDLTKNLNTQTLSFVYYGLYLKKWTPWWKHSCI